MNIGAEKFEKMTYLVLEIDDKLITKHGKYLWLFESFKIDL